MDTVFKLKVKLNREITTEEFEALVGAVLAQCEEVQLGDDDAVEFEERGIGYDPDSVEVSCGREE